MKLSKSSLTKVLLGTQLLERPSFQPAVASSPRHRPLSAMQILAEVSVDSVAGVVDLTASDGPQFRFS